jgi:hypothetical protein
MQSHAHEIGTGAPELQHVIGCPGSAHHDDGKAGQGADSQELGEGQWFKRGTRETSGDPREERLPGRHIEACGLRAVEQCEDVDARLLACAHDSRHGRDLKRQLGCDRSVRECAAHCRY